VTVRAAASALGVTQGLSEPVVADIAYNAVVVWLAYPRLWSRSTMARALESGIQVAASGEPVRRLDMAIDLPPEAQAGWTHCERMGRPQRPGR
jgi:hypothetical protein